MADIEIRQTIRTSSLTADLADLVDDESRRSPEFHASATDADVRMRLFRRFAEVRKQKRLSQTEVADRMKTTQSAISDLER